MKWVVEQAAMNPHADSATTLCKGSVSSSLDRSCVQCPAGSDAQLTRSLRRYSDANDYNSWLQMSERQLVAMTTTPTPVIPSPSPRQWQPFDNEVVVVVYIP